MKLLVDLGNSRCKTCYWQQQLADMEDWSHDQLPKMPASADLQGVIACSVAPAAVMHALEAWCAAQQVPIQWITAEHRIGGVRSRYSRDRLGSDRWMAIVGARSLSNNPLCVIDCGTAVTVDMISADGEHLGGCITPGLRAMRSALQRTTHQLPEIALQGAAPFGLSTDTAIAGGTRYTLAGAIDRLIGEAGAQLGPNMQATITGGDAQAILPLLHTPCQLEPKLIFKGLAIAGDCI